MRSGYIDDAHANLACQRCLAADPVGGRHLAFTHRGEKITKFEDDKIIRADLIAEPRQFARRHIRRGDIVQFGLRFGHQLPVDHREASCLGQIIDHPVLQILGEFRRCPQVLNIVIDPHRTECHAQPVKLF